MQHTLLIDYERADAPHGYVVRALLRLEGQAPTQAERVPLNLSIVLDRSGSMGGAKLAAAREAAALLVRRLAPEDTVSVVAYDGEVITVAEPGDGSTHADLQRRIAAIGSGGSTNLSGGWLRGRELVSERKRDGAVNRVLLLTDGQANVGITEPALLAGLCGAAKREGITTSTIGFGADYDERLLRAMSDAGGGDTYYIEEPDQAPGVFEEEIEGLLSLAAQNVAVEIRPGDAVQLVAVHHDYPSSAVAGGRRFELGDLYAREPRALLVEFLAPAGTDPQVRLATLTVHAHVLTESGVERQEIAFPVHATLDGTGHEEPEVRREMLLLEAARAREEALRRREMGDVEGASDVLREASRKLAASPWPQGSDVSEQARDLAEAADRVESDAYDSRDAKYLAQRAYNTWRGKRMYEEKLSRVRRRER